MYKRSSRGVLGLRRLVIKTLLPWPSPKVHKNCPMKTLSCNKGLLWCPGPLLCEAMMLEKKETWVPLELEVLELRKGEVGCILGMQSGGAFYGTPMLRTIAAAICGILKSTAAESIPPATSTHDKKI